MTDERALMLELGTRLKAAHSELTREFQSRPRRAPMMDRYCRVWNGSHYGLVLSNDATEYGDPERPAIDQLRKDLAKVEKLIARLKADPYVCTTPWRIKEWRRHYGQNF